MSDFFDKIKAIVDRREQAKNFKMHCPVCMSAQVQLCAWSSEAKWTFRCRHCATVWEAKIVTERTPKGLPKK